MLVINILHYPILPSRAGEGEYRDSMVFRSKREYVRKSHEPRVRRGVSIPSRQGEANQGLRADLHEYSDFC
jgi:hypothetical protein